MVTILLNHLGLTSHVSEKLVQRNVEQKMDKTLMVTIYISSNQSVQKIIEFIHKNLIAYTKAGSTLLSKLPIILIENFNVDFSKDKSKPLVDFLKSKFNLIVSNDPNERTTKYGTTLDGVFFR
ncbi:UNVERIFIED_CONTAM: hypothetical protein NCL1_03175 [Trichonephila clavipes]